MHPETLNFISDTIIQLQADYAPAIHFRKLAERLKKYILFDTCTLSLPSRGQRYQWESLCTTSAHISTLFAQTDSSATWVFFKETSLIRNNLAEDIKFEDDHLLVQRGIRSEISFHISVAGKVMGVITLQSKTPNQFTTAHADQLQQLTQIIGLVTKKILDLTHTTNEPVQQLLDANQNLKEKEELLTALQSVSNSSFSYLDLDEILDNFGKQIIQSGIFRSLMIALVDHDAREIEVVRAFQRELPENPLNVLKIENHDRTCGTRYKLDDNNITPLTARTGKLQMASSIEDPRLDHKYEEDSDWTDKVAYFIPIIHHDKVVAVLATGSRQHQKSDFLKRLSNMRLLFDQFGIALENALLYRQVRQNQHQYRTLFENIQSAFALRKIEKDENGNPVDYTFVEVNRAYEEQTGLGRKALIGKRVTEVMPEIQEEYTDWITRYAEIAETGKAMTFEDYVQSNNTWYSVAAYSPQKGYVATVSTDITTRKQTEIHLHELSEFQNQMLNTPLMWISAFRPDRTFNFWNRGAELISGYSREEALDNEEIWHKLYPNPDYFKEYVRSAKALVNEAGQITNIESQITCKDGQTKTMSWYAHRLVDRDNNNLGYFTIGIDVSLRKQLESEVVRLERLKALGEMAAGVSHNLNNILTGILLPATMLKTLTLPPDVMENVEDILTSAMRARDLVTQLNRSVKSDLQAETEPVDVDKIVTQAVRATRAKWKDETESNGINVQIHMRLNAMSKGHASNTGLHDILVNLILNAVDALPNGGQIHIETHNIQGAIEIVFKDDGIGMDPEVKLRVFEPFFTTKLNVGTGLGLSTAFKQIQTWGGEMSVESEPQQGSTFRLKIPLWKGRLPKDQTTETSPNLSGLKILIVDDVPLIRTTLSRILSEEHEIALAENCAQAIQIIQNRPIDIALIDLGLPDIPGHEVAAQLRKRNPALKTILMTGWSISPDDARLKNFDGYLQKPIVDIKALKDTMAKAFKKNAG